MSNQTTVGSFIEKTPPAGSIRVLYKEQNGVKDIRALTISNVDKNGVNIKLSLDAIESIRAGLNLTSSLDRTQLNVISKTSKPENGGLDYYYLDTTDKFVPVTHLTDTVSNGPITITPYLTEPFFNNDYNALISNAETIRATNKRYDVDRVSGFVYPSNYNAIAGIGKIDYTDLLYNNNDGLKVSEFATQGGAPLSSYSVSGSTTSFATTPNDQDVEIRVDTKTIIDAIGVTPSILIDNFSPSFHNNPNAYIAFESKLIIEIDNNSNFFTNGAKYQSAVLAQQSSSLSGNNSSGEHETTINAFTTTIVSGSHGGDVFIRLKQTNKVLSNNGLYFGVNHPDNVTYSIKSFLFATPNTQNNLPISLYYDSQVPYAPFAPVQDSNYTHTGHINARYNGTKTGESDFSGIGSAVTAKPFQGASYLLEAPSTYTDTTYNNLICSQSTDEREIEDFLFEGETDLPVVATKLLGEVDALNPLTHNLDNTVVLQTFPGEYFSPGDILTFDNGAAIEVIQVLAVSSSTGGKFPKVTLTVKRRFNGASTSLTFPAGSQVVRTAGSRIYKTKGNRLIPVGSQRLWVKDNRTIVKTNDRGFVIELSTTCTV